MSKITIRQAVKRYGDNTVISGLDLDIRDGELFTLLGPSGCGKTTLLRMIAGFNSIEGGDFYFGDERINDKDPAKRNIGMVFQNYAIFPHMTVFDNVAFGLKNRKVDKPTLQRETERFLKMMQIDEYAKRLPQNLSGGQQQRVALARALVIAPDVLLMDEPLSNLDAKLRVEMRSAIRDIQREVGITTVYVTHDQEEAMSISDTIAVMRDGAIQHLGTPREIYQRPANLFVATFIGRTNVLPGALGGGVLSLAGGRSLSHDSWRTLPAGPVKVSIRPEEFSIAPADAPGLEAVITDSTYLGRSTHYTVELGGEKVEVVEESSIDETHRPGDAVRLAVKCREINIFDVAGENNLLRGERHG
ncbi:ABC transporter ATP-binding protein [Ruminococcaceae bacterium OttesenSCG-928-D13]|nr:ABC transporter ATP-binding protein [Ruminococcaceae bacterium OttesenSCG-928-D13]